MNFMNIYDMVEERRPLNLLSSFPVIMEKDKELEVMWFYFFYQKNEENGTVQVINLCTTQDGETITEENMMLQETVKWSNEKETKMDEVDYYEQLGQLYENFNANLMQSLLEKAEHAVFLNVYKKVMQYLENTEKETGEFIL